MLAALGCLLLQSVAVLGQNTCGYYNVTDALGILNQSPTLMYVRPVKNWMEPTYVEIDVIFRAVIEMDQKLQMLTTLMDFEMRWQNRLLSWNPQEFCGIARVPIPADSIWTPDIYVSETTEDNSLDTIYMLLSNNGSVQKFKTLHLVTTCSLDLYKFPFDSQKCNLSFGMSITPATDAVIAPITRAEEITNMSKNIFSTGEWSLQDIDIFVAKVSRRGDEWSQVTYQIHIKRAPILYVINLIIPACLLVFVDVASMFIPMEGGERLGFKITVVLGFSVLLLILNDFLPNTDNPPILGVFCMVCLLIMIISIMDSIFISYMLYLSAVRPDVPGWLRLWVLKRLAYALCIDTKVSILDSSIVGAQNKGMVGEEAVPQEPDFHTEKLAVKDKDNPENKLLKRILLELLMVRRHLIVTKKEEESKSEWNLVAFVLDRFILILYLFIVALIMVVVVVVWAF